MDNNYVLNCSTKKISKGAPTAVNKSQEKVAKIIIMRKLLNYSVYNHSCSFILEHQP